MSLNTTIDAMVSWIDRIAAVLLGAITLLVFAAAMMRYVFAIPIPDAYDVSRLLLGCALLWGLASGCFRGNHIQVDLLWEVLPPLGRRLVDLFANLLTCIAIAAFAWMLLTKVQAVQASGEETFDVRLAVWPFYAVAWLGVAAATVSSLARLYLLATRQIEASAHSAVAE